MTPFVKTLQLMVISMRPWDWAWDVCSPVGHRNMGYARFEARCRRGGPRHGSRRALAPQLLWGQACARHV